MSKGSCRGVVRQDFINALREIGSLIDVTVDDLMILNEKVEKYARQRATANLRVSDLMNREVVTVRKDNTLAEAAHHMVTRRISGLPVVDDHEKLIGVITEADFLRALGVPSHHPTHNLWQTLEAMFSHPIELKDTYGLVSDLMITDVVTVTPGQTVHDVIEVMKKNRIKRVIVCDAERLVRGMVTRSDLVRIFFDRVRSIETQQDG